MVHKLAASIVSVFLTATSALAEDISGEFNITGGKTDIGPKSENYDFDAIKLSGRLVFRDHYFLSYVHSDLKHRSTNKKHTLKSNHTKIGYSVPLSNNYTSDLIGNLTLFASLGYFNTDNHYNGQFPDSKGSGTSYSLGSTLSASEQLSFTLEITTATYNSGSLNGKKQIVSELSATYYVTEKVGFTVSYNDVDSRFTNGADSVGWESGLKWKF